jgi:ATP-dependent exoDNAse (exonuclease V) beta subunit
MKKGETKNPIGGISLPQPSSSDLRGRQSVRATFKLSEKAIDALSIISVHLGIKQKSLFDHLIDDIETLERIAQEIQSSRYHVPNRVQKTYVLSRKTLSSLDRASRNFDASRNALVEFSLQRLMPMIAREREKHKKREEILSELTEYLQDGLKILKKTKASLGVDDPIYEQIANAMSTFLNIHDSIETFVEKGKIIEKF